MKTGPLINSEISATIARMGHTDQLTLADAGLPIPDGVQRIDLAVARGLPQLLPVLSAVLTELKVEAVIMAEEFASVSPDAHQAILKLLRETYPEVKIETLSHEAFKRKTSQSKAVIRTGECTPYANLILQSGVAF
ncbi:MULTISPECIES: D-ribose pyranase [unclassified Lentimonas]|uniref:D-ribose pyranase n=1 Tax=unclassified Lentimonas TaxID=2630993 RepID=UPI00132B1407|nr:MULTISPECIES: D-ribose pyranase [unclassified Lentimonas]CAA6678594.1 Ribose ABC transport system, high affinity permease RbsD (TC 3.A.1.2.1) [Lentimonas sp. CC4]CAA6685826.1 Ribose ABC transport system, high affinity permease RbsD (TC 3.A.1.2.1) [Lentimonas sp. CC6]CAA7076300.1 Ribose ABC transport system, high affinity permease RbsD (TC 3.A.1.2.1) [Lentimonas sp. CC4]CAA7171966.1 Ribose ABC transport system, high affinity permease RbsD (TC 3.A.1.2.1) [Lentimonas sp. CC21]CAA7181555.1 Ribo